MSIELDDHLSVIIQPWLVTEVYPFRSFSWNHAKTNLNVQKPNINVLQGDHSATLRLVFSTAAQAQPILVLFLLISCSVLNFASFGV